MNPTDVLRVLEELPPIRIKDPLMAQMGLADENGIVNVNVVDCLRESGMFHPTAASAFWLCHLAATSLEGLLEGPVTRGEIMVNVRGQVRDLGNGIASRVFSKVFGAYGEDGFKGWEGQHSRRRLLVFEQEDFDVNTFDVIHWPSGVYARVNMEPEELPYSVPLQNLLFNYEKRDLTAEEAEAFAPLWAKAVYDSLLSPEARGDKVYFVKSGHDYKHDHRVSLLKDLSERLKSQAG